MAHGRQPLIFAAAVFAVVGALAYFILPDDPPDGVRISTNPEKAMIFANGNYAGLSPVIVPAGPGDQILVRTLKKDYAEFAGCVQVERANQAFLLELKKQADASIEIKSTPASARVFVNGIPAGATPCIARDLAPDEYEILVEHPGYVAETRKISVHSGEWQKISLVLQSSTILMLRSKIKEDPHDVSSYSVLAMHYLDLDRTREAVDIFIEGLKNWNGVYDFDRRRNSVSKLYDRLKKDDDARAALSECCLEKIGENRGNLPLGQKLIEFAPDPEQTVDWLMEQLERPATELERHVLNFLLLEYICSRGMDYSAKRQLFQRCKARHPEAAVGLATQVALVFETMQADPVETVRKFLAELPGENQLEAKRLLVMMMAEKWKLVQPFGDLAHDMLENHLTPELVERILPSFILASRDASEFVGKLAEEHPDLTEEKAAYFAQAFSRKNLREKAHQFAPEVFVGEVEQRPSLEADPAAEKAFKAARVDVDKLKKVIEDHPNTLAAYQAFLTIMTQDPTETTVLIRDNVGAYRRRTTDLFHLGVTYLRNLLDTENGVPVMEEYIKCQRQYWPNPTLVIAFEAIGEAYLLGQKQPQKAIDWYEKYFDECRKYGLFPTAAAITNTGLAYCLSGEKEKALAYWRRVAGEFPWEEDAVQARYLSHFYYDIDNLLP